MQVVWNFRSRNLSTQLRVFNTDRWQVDSPRNLVMRYTRPSVPAFLRPFLDQWRRPSHQLRVWVFGNRKQHLSETTLSTSVFWLERNTCKHGLNWDVWYINIYIYIYVCMIILSYIVLQYNITYYILRTCIRNLFSFRIQQNFRIPLKTRRVTLTKNCGESAYQATYKAYLKSMLQPRHLGFLLKGNMLVKNKPTNKETQVNYS